MNHLYRRFNRIFKRTVRCHFVFKIIWQIIPYFCPSIFYREFSITSMYHRSWSCVIVVYIFIFWKIISEVWEQIAFITGAFFMSQARRTRHFARSVRRGEEKNKASVTTPLFWLFPRYDQMNVAFQLVNWWRVVLACVSSMFVW